MHYSFSSRCNLLSRVTFPCLQGGSSAVPIATMFKTSIPPASAVASPKSPRTSFPVRGPFRPTSPLGLQMLPHLLGHLA